MPFSNPFIYLPAVFDGIFLGKGALRRSLSIFCRICSLLIIAARATSDQLIYLKESISCFNSAGTAKVNDVPVIWLCVLNAIS